jgi:hypothetical protein
MESFLKTTKRAKKTLRKQGGLLGVLVFILCCRGHQNPHILLYT